MVHAEHAARRRLGAHRPGAATTRAFDLLVVANGHHWDPRTAEFPGEFTGESLHSHHYIDPTDPLDLKGKRILVVGLGNSAADIAVELSGKSLQNQVTLSTRSQRLDRAEVHRTACRPTSTSRPRRTSRWPGSARLVQKMQFMTGSNPELYGLPKPNHKFFEAHPTQSVELPLRLGSGDVIPKAERRAASTARPCTSRTARRRTFDVIVYATGYNITFPFFDEEFLSAPGNQIRLFKRMFKPGIDDLVFMGFAQAVPTLFPFVEAQARLLAAYAVGALRAARRRTRWSG